MNGTQTLVTFGKFDGVHLGHQKILAESAKLAKSNGLASVALILDSNLNFNFSIRKVHRDASDRGINPGVAENSVNGKSVTDVIALTTLHERQRLIKALGIDYVVTQKLNSRFKALTSDQFLRDVLQTRLGASMVILGPGQQFGVDMASFQTFSNAQEEPHSHSAELISRAVRVELPPNRIADNIETCVDDNSLAETLELAEMTECAIVDGERVSSQAIREAIQQQNFDLVNRKLGRRYALRGLVVKGEQRGRQIGFPTANIGHIETIIPPAGVYHCLTTIRNQTFPVAVSIGYNQTFGANLPISVEGHIIANPAHSTAATKFNLYGKYLTIEFVRLLRPMRKFNSVNELIAQISDDVRQILSSNLSESN